MSVRLALIDLDGTLIDSAPELAMAVDKMLAGSDLPTAGVEQVRGWIGEGIDALVARALAEQSGRDPDEDACRAARSLFDTAYAEVIGTQSHPYPGVFDGLDRLRAAGVATACITNKARMFSISLLGSLDLLNRFDLLVAGDSGPAKKPSAEPLLHAAERLGVDMEQCVMIGDSRIDVAAAHAAGCPAWCVRTGYSRGQDPEQMGADALFDRFDGLVDRLLAADSAA